MERLQALGEMLEISLRVGKIGKGERQQASKH